MRNLTKRETASRILAQARAFGASMAGLAAVTDLQQAPSFTPAPRPGDAGAALPATIVTRPPGPPRQLPAPAAGGCWPSPDGFPRVRPQSEGVMTFSMFVQHFLNALTLGSLYALIAIGYTMV